MDRILTPALRNSCSSRWRPSSDEKNLLSPRLPGLRKTGEYLSVSTYCWINLSSGKLDGRSTSDESVYHLRSSISTHLHQLVSIFLPAAAAACWILLLAYH